MAALTLASHSALPLPELSLQQHLQIAPDLSAYSTFDTEADSEPSMMAQQVPHQATDKKRVKVYELRDNDWYDRGTGFCTATFIAVGLPKKKNQKPLQISLSPLLMTRANPSCHLSQTEEGRKDPRVLVESEEHPERLLLETKIQKEDGFQKQQGTFPPEKLSSYPSPLLFSL